MDVALKATAADNAAGDPMAADIRRQVEEADVFTEGIPPFSVARGHLVLALGCAPDCLTGTRSASGIEKPRQGLTRTRRHASGRAFFCRLSMNSAAAHWGPFCQQVVGLALTFQQRSARVIPENEEVFR